MNEDKRTHQGLVHVNPRRYTAECTCGWVGGTYPYEALAVDAAQAHAHEGPYA